MKPLKQGQYTVATSNKGFCVIRKNRLIKDGFKTQAMAKAYAKRLGDTKPMNDMEQKLYDQLERSGYKDIQFAQRFDYGDQYVMLRVSNWEFIDALTLKKLQEIEPSVDEFNVFDDHEGFKYGYHIWKD